MKTNIFVHIFLIMSIALSAQTPVFNFDTTINLSLSRDTCLTLFQGSPVTGIGVNGSITLNSDSAFVRIIVKSSQGIEYLIYETYSMLTDTNSFNFFDECEESCFIENYYPDTLLIQIQDASLTLNSLKWSDIPYLNIPDLQYSAKLNKDTMKIRCICSYIHSHNLIWIPGKTKISNLFYRDKKILFGERFLSYGWEYYKGGIFSISSTNPPSPTYGYVDNFDWRNRHKANSPESPYFDGDYDHHTGWITPVRCISGCWNGWELECITEDACANLPGLWRMARLCWLFAAVGQAEALTNLYFNQQIDLDLSEQYISCLLNTIDAGMVYWALNKFVNPGIIDEGTLPYEANTHDCPTQLPEGQERINIENYQTHSNSTVSEVKDLLIEYGPLSASVLYNFTQTKTHAMTLVGWGTIDEDFPGLEGIPPAAVKAYLGVTYWIYKDGYGWDWGNDGFIYYIGKQNSGIPASIINNITKKIIRQGHNDDEIRCLDEDNDGFYFWVLVLNHHNVSFARISRMAMIQIQDLALLTQKVFAQ